MEKEIDLKEKNIFSDGLNMAAFKIHNNAKSKGFWDKKPEVGTLLMSCVRELSEALDADMKGKKGMLSVFEEDMGFAGLSIKDFVPENENFDWIKNRFENTIKDSFEDELADTIMWIFDICGAMHIDIEKHINLKMAYNKTREYLHGKKY